MIRRVGIAVTVMGFSGLAAQIILLRELLIVFSGNELSIGVIFANWVMLEAIGCYFLPGRLADRSRNALPLFALITILFSLSLPAAVLLTRSLKGLLGVSVGESLGLGTIFGASLLILLPVSILHGALFPLSCRIYAAFSARDAPAAGRVYAYETLGTLVGGIACTALLVPHLNTVQAALGLAALNLVTGIALLAPFRGHGPFHGAMLVALSGLLLLAGYLLFGGPAERLHRASVRAQWPNLNVLHYENSRYGNICVIENQGQYIFFQDGVPGLITPVPDILAVQEFVHLPLLAHPLPARILIVSGGAGGVINEVLRHPSIESVEYAELDPLILSLLRKFATPLTESELNDPRVQVRHVDGRLLLRTTPARYDLIFVGIEEPSSLQTNRFFTREFFALARDRLDEGGILVLGVPGSLAFPDEGLRNLNSSIYHTLRAVFGHVRVLPGDDRNLLLASDAPGVLAMDRALIEKRLSERALAADVLVPWQIEKRLHPGWQLWFARFIQGSSQRINRDFQPLGLFYSISHWNALFAPAFGRLYAPLEKMDLRWIALALALLLGAFFVRRWRGGSSPPGIPLAIAATGFAGMIFDLVVIFAFQAVYGYVFSWIGLLVASFMAGAACGSLGMTAGLERAQRGAPRAAGQAHRGPFGGAATDPAEPARGEDGLPLRGRLRRLFIAIEMAIVALSAALPLALLAINAGAGRQNAFLLPGIGFLLASFICGLLTGSQFPLANRLYLERRRGPAGTAGLLYAADLTGGWLGGMAGAVMLLPVLGLIGTCVTVGLLKLTSGIIVATHRE